MRTHLLPPASDRPAPLGKRCVLLPALDDLPIPDQVVVGDGWTDQMVELADHVGARPVLLLVDRFGGQRVSIPPRWEDSPFLDFGEQVARQFAWLYGGFRFQVPVARVAVDRARRASVLATVREGRLTVGDAARILGTSRNYVTHLLNAVGEGVGAQSIPNDELSMEAGVRRIANRLIGSLAACGASPRALAALWTRIYVALDVPAPPMPGQVSMEEDSFPLPADLCEIDPTTADPVMLDLIGIAPAGDPNPTSEPICGAAANPEE